MAHIHPGTNTDREIMVELGERLHALRKARGLTLTEVAERATLSTALLLLPAMSLLLIVVNLLLRPHLSKPASAAAAG